MIELGLQARISPDCDSVETLHTFDSGFGDGTSASAVTIDGVDRSIVIAGWAFLTWA